MSGTPLAKKLRRLIDASGPISVAQYMAYCLADPEHGYYMTRDPLGAGGDFVTAPEISQMFGEIVGAWLVHAWRLIGAPSPVILAELGPGRGTLMTDILRVAGRDPEFMNAVTIHLVETSPVLRAAQSARLAPYAPAISWHDSFAQLPEGALLLVANEFFDALPIRQYIRQGNIWRERVVGLEGGELAFGIGPASLPAGPPAPDGAILEICPAADAAVADIVARIARDGGAALVIDYGYAEGGPGETLQAVRGHTYADPLDTPGEADLTAHVDFAALARRARAEGAAVHGPMDQGTFLLSLGLLERAGQLGATSDEAGREALRAAVARLAGPDGMGALFKAMAIATPEVTLPPFKPGV